MTRPGDEGRSDRPTDIFVSYSPADEAWATWIAWELEAAGYRTMVQAWDFVPGTNFIDFMDRGVSEARVVIAVLSRNYLRSTYGRMEWQAALRADPHNRDNKLITIRLEDCPLEGLLSTITYVDLVGVTDPGQARALLMDRIRQALSGRAKPEEGPGFPSPGPAHPAGRERTAAGQVISGEVVPPLPGPGSPAPAPAGPATAASGRPRPVPHPRTAPEPAAPDPPGTEVRPGTEAWPGTSGSGGPRRTRRAPVAPPGFPARAQGSRPLRDSLTVLHVAGPRFGRGLAEAGEPVGAAELQARIWGDMTRLADEGIGRPDLLIVTGDLTESGSRKESAEALNFLTGLRTLLGLEPQRLVVVPGAHDVTQAACRAYFNSCEADDIEPQPPYWPKWRHFAGLFDELYQGFDGLVFDSAQPWTLFPIPDLRVVVAGLNSTMAYSHREDDRYGWIGGTQAAWFAERLRPFEDDGWLRIGVLRHAPLPGEPGGLRDVEQVEGLLGARLNLLVHGAPTEEGLLAELLSGAPCVPALGPGRHQLIEITPAGLARWVRPGTGPDGRTAGAGGGSRTGGGSGAGPERLERTWHAAAATFPAPGPAPEAVGGPGAGAPALGPGAARETAAGHADEAEHPQDPTSLLLDRIDEVCATRFERVKTRRIAGDPPHLLVTHMEDGFVRQFRVAAQVGEPTSAEVEAFLRQVRAGGPDHGSELVYLGPAPSRSLRDEALRAGIRLRSFTEFQGLLDLSGYVAEQAERLAADLQYPPDLYVPQRFREPARPDLGIRDDAVAEIVDLLTSDHGRFLLLLGDFGRGKTFALREVARRISADLPHLVPILIELRALDKAHSVDGLVAAHLANHGEELIDLRAFHYMLRQGRVVLLFDGFDELVTRVTFDRAADHLDTLLQAAEGQAKIVVASRTQHFRSHAQVLTALGERVGLLPQRKVLSLEDFTSAQIRAYLVNRYGDEATADRRMRLLADIEDLTGLAKNPRMLGFIADLDEERLRAVARVRHTVSAADLYREILGSWLAFEERRSRGVRGAPAGLGEAELWQAVSTLAMRLWETNEPVLRLAELTEVAGALTELADGRLSEDQAAHAVGAGSLLVRTEEGLFGFIHGSVVEWLVAHRIAADLATGSTAPAALSRRPLSQLTVDFLCDLADVRACQAWAAAVLADHDADDVSRTNALKVTSRLRTPARADLRGANLHGEDLSYRDLQEVDLTGANLSDAQLVGVDLSRATLRNAILAGARLDEARLAGADLRGADLSRARLARTDLRDVTVEGGRWTRAALIDAAGAGRLQRLPELRDAAIAPGRPVDLQLAPATVGVPYGFHFQTSRLPEPVAYSPDGGVVAVGADDGGVLVCDAVTGTPLRTLSGHRERTYAVTFGATGTVLATGSADGTLRLWDPATGECRRALRVHPEGVWPVLVSPDGRLVAAGAADGVVRIWSATTGEPHGELPGHHAPVYTAVFGPDGGSLITGDAAAVIRVWDLSAGRVLRTLEGHAGAVYRVAFSPDGGLLAAGDRDGVIRLWNVTTGEIHTELTGHTGRIYTLAFHPAGRILATGDTDGSVRLWDPVHGTCLLVLTGHTGGVYQIAFTPDGETLATADSDGSVRLWDAVTGHRRLDLVGHRGAVWPFAIRPDGGQLATSSNDGTTRLWDTATGQCRQTLRGHGRRITSVRFSRDGTMLASSGNDGIVRLWEPRTGRRIRELTGTADRLTSAIFSPVGSRLATASNDGGVHLWQAGTGAFERELNVETDHVWAAAFSPDGEILATANDDDSVRLWYRQTGRLVSDLADHRGRVRSIDFSPDGREVATGCDDGAVRLWDAESGTCRAVLREHTDRVYSVAYSPADPAGRLLVSAGNDGVARLWDTGARTVLHTLTEHAGRLWTAAFSPDGSLLATAGDDLAIRLWDPRDGRLLHTLTGHTRRILSVDFGSGGTLLASAGDDGTIIVWDVGDDTAPRRLVTLLGLPEGWAALAPDGRYKQEGDVVGQFWYSVNMCRFEPGELDRYLPGLRRIAADAEF